MRNTMTVRQIIRKHQAANAFIWTNKYKKTRTVKFHNLHPYRTQRVIDELAQSGLEHSVKIRPAVGGWVRDSVIITLPIEY